MTDRNKQVFTLKLSAKRVPQPLVEAARWTLDRIMGFPKFNAIYAALPPCQAVDFSRTLLEAMHIKVAVAGQKPDTIPATGPLIVVANHCCGFVEGVALDALLMERRPDVTFWATYIFAAIPEFRERWIFVDPQRSRRKRKLNPEGIRASYNRLARGEVLALFPAGRVARFSWRRMRITEQPWSPHIAGIARRTQTRVLPIYFHGRNSWFFHLLGGLHPRLQHLLFVRELLNKRGRRLHATIGRLIEPAELARFATDDDAIEFLREETEKLSEHRS